MTEPSRDDEIVVTDSGGTMTRMPGAGRGTSPDLKALEPLRRVTVPGPLRPAGEPPYLEPGDVVSWHYGASADVLRVVRDDARGLVAWLPSGSERVAAVPRDGRGIRDRSLEERARLSAAGDYRMEVVPWRGPGLLRIAPTAVPWSIWYFHDDDGTFEGHYVNLELVHERPVDGSPRVHTRDLTLDLWFEAGEVWLKDADELVAGTAVGKYSERQAAAIHEVAELARDHLVRRTWPLDEDWETWQPPADWDEPLTMPADLRAGATSG
jgi:hypothetical protein